MFTPPPDNIVPVTEIVDPLEQIKTSIDQEYRRAASEQAKGNQDDWAPGGGSTTGICAAYAFECVNHIEKHAEDENIPPLITTTPSDQMKFLEMLLVQGIYKSLGSNQTYRDVTFTEANRNLVNQSCKAFADLVRSQTGLKVVGQYPLSATEDPDFTRTIPMTQRGDLVNALSQSEKEHHIIFFRNPNSHLSAGHIMYVNSKKGIIADGVNGFIWKIPEAQKQHFNEALNYYLTKNYSNTFREISSIAIEKTFNLKSKVVPLAVRKLGMYSNLIFNLGRKEGVKKAAGATLMFVANHKAIKKVKSSWDATKDAFNTTRSLVKSIYSPQERLELFHSACMEGKLKTVKLLLKMGVNPNERLNEITPLTWAIKNGHLELVKTLVDAGALVHDDSFDNYDSDTTFLHTVIGASPVTVALQSARPDILEYLLSKGVRILPQHLYLAVRTVLEKKEVENLKTIEILLRTEFDRDHPSLRDIIYYAASYYEKEETLKLLLEAGFAVLRENSNRILNILINKNRSYKRDYDRLHLPEDIPKIEKNERIIRLILDAGFDLENYQQIYGNDNLIYLRSLNLLKEEELRKLNLL